MALSNEYLNEINALNKEVQRANPKDILQFCFNYFQKRLEDQRKYLYTQESKAKAAGLTLFPQLEPQDETIGSSGPQFKTPFGDNDPHAKDIQHSNGDPHSIGSSGTPAGTATSTAGAPGRGSAAAAPTGNIFKSNFEVGEENKTKISNTVDPITRRTSTVQPLPSFNNSNIPVSFNANRRTSVSAETLNPNGIKDDWKPPVIPKTIEQLNRLSQSVVKNFLFSSLDEDSLKTVIDALKEVKIAKDVEVIRQGDEGDYFYIVESGIVNFYVNGDKVNSSGPGSSFGELALMYNSPRAATAVAETDLILWALDRLTFRRILLAKTSKKRQLYESFLKEVPVLYNLSLFERSKLADALDREVYKPGDVIIKEGEVGENFYLIEKGEANVFKENEGLVSSLKRGDYFGEVALLNDLPRQASVIAKTEVQVATLDKRGFQRLLGPAVEVLKRQDPTKHH